MLNREIEKDVSPHQHAESPWVRYAELLMSLTYQHPELMKNIVLGLTVGSLALTVSPSFIHLLGGNISRVTAMTATTIGALGSVVSLAAGFAQHRIFGFPVKKDSHPYEPMEFSYQSATANLTVNPNQLPILKITADTHYDAGYVEGYALAPAMRKLMKHTNFLYPFMRAILGAPKFDWELEANLQAILETIPNQYQNEMSGKVDGYNAWLAQHYPDADKLSFAKYVLLQMLPDLRNYNPFPKSSMSKLHAMLYPEMACTSIALRLGEYTFFTRILDWPSHGVGGELVIQINRNINGVTATTDIAVPLLSGALTILNESGVLIEMNIAPGNTVKKPQGMPAVFFNRYCAERAKSVDGIETALAKKQPLGSYHLTATDGVNTKSYHFYMNQEVANTHHIETLSDNKESPQLLLVANHGLRFHKTAVSINHRDSTQRVQNILHFFNRDDIKAKLDTYLQKQLDQTELSAEAIRAMREICLLAARLPLVNNAESVICCLLVYRKHELMMAHAAVDNLYAPTQALENFKECYAGEASVTNRIRL